MTNSEHNAAMDRLHEAQRVVDLAEKEGLFEDCYVSATTKRGRKATVRKIRARAEELLAGQYPDLNIRIVPGNSRMATVRGRTGGGLFDFLSAPPRYRVELVLKRRLQDRWVAR
jgi:hypothetical protein